MVMTNEDLVEHSGRVTQLNREGRREAQRQTSGFKPDRKRYRLRWPPEHELGPSDDNPEGLVVMMRGISVGTFMEVAEMADIDPRHFTKDQLPQVKRLFVVVGEALAEWNLLDEDGAPVPATYAGVMTQDFPMVMSIIEGWMQAIGDVGAPLERPSADGKPSAALSIPMEVE